MRRELTKLPQMYQNSGKSRSYSAPAGGGISLRGPHKKRKFQAGFTITEVVVASSLLVVAMVPLFRALGNSHASTVAIEHKTFSLVLAQAKLDEIKARSIYHFSDSFSETDTVLADYYLCNVTDDAGDPLRTIIVSVGYDDDADGSLSGDEVNIVLSTLVARRW